MPCSILRIKTDDGRWIEIPTIRGEKGTSIVDIRLDQTDGLNKTYIIEFSDGNASYFTVKDGNYISNISKTSTTGLTDTYTIQLADENNTSYNLHVTNGKGITKVEKTNTSGLTDTYTISYNDGSQQPYTVSNGKGITKVEKTDTTILTDTYTTTYNDGTTQTYTVTNGKGITSLEKTATSEDGLTDTYTISFNDGSTKNYNVGHGKGITSLEKTATNVLTDTYTITYNDGTSKTYDVTNGKGITKIEKTSTSTDGLTDTYTITYNDNATQMYNVGHGKGITSLEKTSTSADGLTDTYTITYNDGTNKTYNVGHGRGITNIEKTNTVGLTDTYTITYNDGTNKTYNVTNGKGITKVEKTNTVGLTDTYTTTYNDNTTQNHIVSHGKGITKIEKTATNGFEDTYTITYNDNTTQTYTVTNGENFSIYKTYASITAMNTDAANVSEGKFVMITSNTEDPDNSKLYVKSNSGFSFVTDMSGSQGIQGPKGDKGDTGDKGDKGDAFVYENFTTAQLAGLKGEKGDQGIQGIQGVQGIQGETGYVYTPAVDADGNISWTNNGNLDNPTTVNIQGPQGEQGVQGIQGERGYVYTPSISEDGVISWTNNGNLDNPSSISVKGPQGIKGDTGVSVTGVTLKSQSGLDKTYTMTFSNGNTFDYVVSNGAAGSAEWGGIGGVIENQSDLKNALNSKAGLKCEVEETPLFIVYPYATNKYSYRKTSDSIKPDRYYSTTNTIKIFESKVDEGDEFILNYSGGVAARGYAFYDKDDNRISVSEVNQTFENETIIAPTGAVYGIFQTTTSNASILWKHKKDYSIIAHPYFDVIYGTTTFEEVHQAIVDGLIPRCIYGGIYYDFVGVSSYKYMFTASVLTTSNKSVSISKDDVWNNTSSTLFKTSSIIKSTATTEEDDSSVYSALKTKEVLDSKQKLLTAGANISISDGGFKEAEYLTITNQRIDFTDYITLGTDWKLNFTCTFTDYDSVAVQPLFVGAENNALWLGILNGYFVVRTYNGSDHIQVAKPTQGTEVAISVEYTTATNNVKLYFNEVLQGEATVSFSSASKYYLFSDGYTFPQIQFKECKLYTGESITNEFIPATLNSVYYVYDLTAKKSYTPTIGSAFEGGAETSVNRIPQETVISGNFNAVDSLGYTPLNKTGDTMTGDLNMGGKHIQNANYVYANLYKINSSVASTAPASEFLVRHNGWIYSRTPSEVLSDIGALSKDSPAKAVVDNNEGTLSFWSGTDTEYDALNATNYTLVGTPTVSDEGIASNFTFTDHLRTTITSNLTSATNWTIICKAKITSNAQAGCVFGKEWSARIMYYPDTQKAEFRYMSASTEWAATPLTTPVLSLNTYYWFKVNRTVSGYSFYYSTDGETYTLCGENTDTSNITTCDSVDVGMTMTNNYPFLGEIDLNEFKVIADGTTYRLYSRYNNKTLYSVKNKGMYLGSDVLSGNATTSDKADSIKNQREELSTTLDVTCSNKDLTVTNNYQGTMSESGTVTKTLTFGGFSSSDVSQEYLNERIIYGNGVYVAYTDYSIYWSEDLVTWTQALYASGRAIRVVGFGNDNYFTAIAANSGTNQYVIKYYSTDGKTWTQATGSNTACYSIGRAHVCDIGVGLTVKKQSSDSYYTISAQCGTSQSAFSHYYDNNAYAYFRSANGYYFTSTSGTSSFRYSSLYHMNFSVNSTLSISMTGSWFLFFYYNNQYYIMSTCGKMATGSTPSGAFTQQTYPLSFTASYMMRVGDAIMFTNGKKYAYTEDMVHFVEGEHDYYLRCQDYAGINNGVNGEFLFIDMTNKKLSKYTKDSWMTEDMEHANLSDYSIAVIGLPQGGDTLTLTYTTESTHCYYKMWNGSYNEYNALATKDNNTLYLVNNYGLYKGSSLVMSEATATYDATNKRLKFGG